MNKIFMIGMVVFSFLACNHDHTNKKTADFVSKSDTVCLSESSPIKSQLIIQKVEKSSYEFDLITSGIVKAIPNNYALIAAPFSGRITKCYVRLGQEVSAGTPVFEISSPSYFETGKAYFQTKEEINLAEKNMKRQLDLFNKGVGVQKDLEEAEVNYAIKKQEFENAVASLKAYQVDTAGLALGQPLIVRSPIKGIVVENTIVIGQYLREDSDPVATVAELSSVWVEGQVKEKDVRYINKTFEVDIKLIAYPEKDIRGQIYNINSIIDEDTRSVQVLVECDNHDKIMKPGMYVTAKFTHLIKGFIVIPLKAVFQMDDNNFVFVQLSKNHFLKKKIEIEYEDEKNAIVKTGIQAGDEIIVDGGFFLLEKK